MKFCVRLHWALLLAVTCAMLSPVPARAATQDVTIRFRPHCEEGQQAASATPCSEFPLYDGETLITYGLKPGDMLDIDIVLQNPSQQPIQSVQSWLSYDPSILEGTGLRITDTFPLVAPGEGTFSAERGQAKLGASNVSGGVRSPEIVFARVQLKVLSASEEPIKVRFFEFSLLGNDGRTKALLVEGGRTVNVIKARPLDLLLYFGEGAPPSIGTYDPTGGSSAPLPPVSPLPTVPPLTGGDRPIPVTPQPTGGASGLATVQPTGLRIMTEGDLVYLLWSPLPDPRVAGYNIYYGTVSGRYIQRRTVSAQTHGVTVRGLPVGTRYYFALTAFSMLEEESEFSHEVAIIVGRPETSTAPFTLTQEPLEREELPPSILPPLQEVGRGRVPGTTGLPLLALAGIILVAGAGSMPRLRSGIRSTLFPVYRSPS